MSPWRMGCAGLALALPYFAPGKDGGRDGKFSRKANCAEFRKRRGRRSSGLRVKRGPPPGRQRFCRLALVAAENIIRPVIAVPRIDAIDRIAIRQRCFGDDDPEHLAFSGPLELEDVAIAFRKRVFPEWKIGAERAVREPDGFQVFFVIADEPLDLCNAVSLLNDQHFRYLLTRIATICH